MDNIFLTLTSIAGQEHPILNKLAKEAKANNIPFIVIGDTKSPENFIIEGCDFYSVERQNTLKFGLAKILPINHYSRKNLAYLIAAGRGAEIIIETDDDNIPYPDFWNVRRRRQQANHLQHTGWTNIYRYFTSENVWPRGFSLCNIRNGPLPELPAAKQVDCPIQQGMANDNPDVDAIFRLISPSAVTFDHRPPIAFGTNTVCPFNSQNTTWFREAFPLLYLPSYCSFRMTDIWRSFVAQRICWTNNWYVLFHHATVRQERNDHNLMRDFSDEIPGYLHNHDIMQMLTELDLKSGTVHIPGNMLLCYEQLIRQGLIEKKEMKLLEAWLTDIAELS